MDGTHIMTFGSQGNEDGELNSPNHVAVTEDNSCLVTDTENNRIVKFDSSGKFHSSFGGKGSSDGQLDRPAGITIDSEGFIIVGDFQNHRVQIFQPDGKFYATFGSEGDGEIGRAHV